MNTIPVKNLEVNSYFSEPVYLSKNYILLNPDTPVSTQLINRLLKWEFRNVYTAGEVRGKIASSTASGEGSSTSTELIDDDLKYSEGKKRAHTLYADSIDFVEHIYNLYKRRGDIPIGMVTDQVKKIIQMVKEDKEYILGFSDLKEETNNYLVSHAVKCTVLSVTIGDYLKLPPHRIIELGISGMLHEIGMMKLPVKSYQGPHKLNPQQKQNLTAHTVLGYKILKEASYPTSIALTALEHHERIDGTGYPRKLSSQHISLYSKIVGLACAYESQVSARPYRESRDGHSSLLALLKDIGKKWEDSVVKALVYSISLYPLGSYVQLESGEIATVVSNSDNPRAPVIKLVYNADGTPIEKQQVINTAKVTTTKINRGLSTTEIETIRSKT